jgi:SAM-dependent methyltransferase
MKQLIPGEASPYRKWFNKWVEKNAKGKVLDIGKSPQWDYGFPTIDINPSLKPTFTGNIEKTSFPSDTFDTILCNGMYEHVSNPQMMIDEVMRILKPRGTVIFGFVGKDYPPYKPDWNYYDNETPLKGEKEKKDFDNKYHYIVCQKY